MSMHSTLYAVLWLFSLFIFLVMQVSESDIYLERRSHLINQEERLFLGGNITLTPKENKVNEMLLNRKFAELDNAYKNSTSFNPTMHFFQSKDLIEKSEVFKIIQALPKGASLHTHFLAAVSADFLVRNITYRPQLYGGIINNVYRLKFLPNAQSDNRTVWSEVKVQRAKETKEKFDIWLKSLFTLNVPNPEEAYPSPEAIWRKFKTLFSTPFEMLSYKPVFQDFITQLLQELYEDHIFYAELRVALSDLYELDGKLYSHREFFQIFSEAVNNFKLRHPEFLGVGFVVSIYRGVERTFLKKAIDEVIELKKTYPKLILGIDLVGFEEEGKLLMEYHEELLEAGRSMALFLHAGETPWFGHTDLNLVDAILLNTSRIGHGFALTKHPILKQLVRERNIAIELSPLSNQILKLHTDPRTHPVVELLAEGFPVVICNDDPSAWDATGLSYDWYIALMAMTPRKAGLGFLKQIALNSIEYSAMDVEEKIKAKEVWTVMWEQALQKILAGGFN